MESHSRSCLALHSIKAMGTNINSDQARGCHSIRSMRGLCHSFWGSANTYKKVFQRFVPYKPPKNLEKPCDLGDNILPVSPLQSGGWSYFVAKVAKDWGTESLCSSTKICSSNLLWGFKQILFGPASCRHLTETGASV